MKQQVKVMDSESACACAIDIEIVKKDRTLIDYRIESMDR